jgi:dephospho-CoA kinase
MIFLYGAPASGKSTLGRALAERLGLHFVDLDERIVAEAGMTIPEIFKSRGEAVFRDIESKALKEVVSGLISKLQTSNFKLSTPTVVPSAAERFCATRTDRFAKRTAPSSA